MYRFIAMHCGYVESNSVSLLVYQCGFCGIRGYETMHEAVTDLALDLYEKYYVDQLSIYENRYTKKLLKCCRVELVKNPEVNFCSKCGKELQDAKFNSDDFTEYVRDLHGATADGYGEAEATPRRQFHWWPFWTRDFIGAPKEEIIYIPENAEYVVLGALLDAKPELRTNDWVFDGWEGLKKR